MIYTGDLVEEKSRTVKLLARAENPDRLLKPGMFVEVEILQPAASDGRPGPGLGAPDRRRTARSSSSGPAPSSSTGARSTSEPPATGQVAVRSGLEPGDEVVVEGGFKLKAAGRRSSPSAER